VVDVVKQIITHILNILLYPIFFGYLP